jgi:hypothetical protein
MPNTILSITGFNGNISIKVDDPADILNLRVGQFINIKNANNNDKPIRVEIIEKFRRSIIVKVVNSDDIIHFNIDNQIIFSHTDPYKFKKVSKSKKRSKSKSKKVSKSKKRSKSKSKKVSKY